PVSLTPSCVAPRRGMHRACTPGSPSTILRVSCTPPPPLYTLFPYTTLFRSTRFQTTIILQRRELIDGRDNKITDDFIVFGGLLRSEEHTSELQSRFDLVCRLLLEKKHDES